jgi:quercetin dioxygenase-like cupin family protein
MLFGLSIGTISKSGKKNSILYKPGAMDSCEICSMKFNLIQMLIIVVTLTACNSTKNTSKMTTDNNTSIFPTGQQLPKQWFTGTAFLYPMISKDKNNNFSAGAVTFEPGARANWHKHPKGQVLIVTEGEGIYQERGKPAQFIKKGDVVNIPENVEHWHGATANSKMVHIAIANYDGEENAVWLNPVTDEEYKAANKK